MAGNDDNTETAEGGNGSKLGETVYAVALFLAGASLLAFTYSRSDGLLAAHGPAVAAFFLCYGLFTISVGYQHPKVGYYSFDRISQVASLLVLGPLDAAWINGLASFIFPWHRLWKGVPFSDVLLAALNNAGLMTLVLLISGRLYLGLGGEVPLTQLDAGGVLLLVGLVLCMQLVNDLGMLVVMVLKGHRIAEFFQFFAIALELGSGATAVLVALVFTLMPVEVFVLLLAVLSVGMLALRQYATMRYKLELLVEERTRSLRQKTIELEELATQDKLTGLFNRRFADNFLQQLLDNAARYRQTFSIALADIDLFKQVNDLHSHATGDEVLKRVADILRGRCRKTDMIARYGGEEFLICFPETSMAQARRLCEQLRNAIESENWASLGLGTGVTASFGIAEHTAHSNVSSLLGVADARLYAAKHGGRNLVVA